MTNGQILRALFTVLVTFLASHSLLHQTSDTWSWVVIGISVATYLAVLGYVYLVAPSKKRQPSAVRARIDEGLRRSRERAAKKQG